MNLTFKKNTHSLCSKCFEKIPAQVFYAEQDVFIEKECPSHGTSRYLLEKDKYFYERFANLIPLGGAFFHTLVLPITYKCNLNCSFCYAAYPDRPELPLGYLKKAIRNFQGPFICLSGGEPTLRADLPEAIEYIKKCAKYPVLITNGLKLADSQYLQALIRKGLSSVLFSFDSFDKNFYKSTKGKDVYQEKKQALVNLKKSGIHTILSATIYPDINEHELKSLFLFAFRNRIFFRQLKIRAVAAVCRHKQARQYFVSDLLEHFSAQLGIDKKILLDNFLNPLPNTYLDNERHTIHHVQFLIHGVCSGNEFVPIMCKSFFLRLFYYLKLTIQKNGISFVFRELKDCVNVMLKKLAVKNNVVYLRSALKKKGIRAIFREFINFIYISFIPITGLPVRLIAWPTKDNIDLQEVDRGIAQLVGDGSILNFCHSLIIEEGQMLKK